MVSLVYDESPEYRNGLSTLNGAILFSLMSSDSIRMVNGVTLRTSSDPISCLHYGVGLYQFSQSRKFGIC